VGDGLPDAETRDAASDGLDALVFDPRVRHLDRASIAGLRSENGRDKEEQADRNDKGPSFHGILLSGPGGCESRTGKPARGFRVLALSDTGGRKKFPTATSSLSIAEDRSFPPPEWGGAGGGDGTTALLAWF
jgi:hypothetical protein